MNIRRTALAATVAAATLTTGLALNGTATAAESTTPAVAHFQGQCTNWSVTYGLDDSAPAPEQITIRRYTYPQTVPVPSAFPIGRFLVRRTMQPGEVDTLSGGFLRNGTAKHVEVWSESGELVAFRIFHCRVVPFSR